jgi:stress response protein YsnF
MLPIGDYKVHIDSVRIEKGSVKLTARILETIRKEEEDANER